MGFRYEPRVAVLTFEPPFDGLEIRASLDLPAARILRLMRELAQLQTLAEAGDDGAFRQAMELFVTVTDGWNWEDADGNPVPLTVDTLMNVIPGSLAFQLINRWAGTVRGVGAPLADASSSPATSLAS